MTTSTPTRMTRTITTRTICTGVHRGLEHYFGIIRHSTGIAK